MMFASGKLNKINCQMLAEKRFSPNKQNKSAPLQLAEKVGRVKGDIRIQMSTGDSSGTIPHG